MSQELSQYKANQLLVLKKNYNTNCISVTQYYNNIINIISRSRAINKAQQVNTVRNFLASSISNLTKKYNTDSLVIQNFTPKQIKIDKAKKALLVGINYTGTSNELFGCINDVNCIKERISTQGFTSINTITDLTTTKPTRDNILKEFKNFLANSQAGDLLYFLYSLYI